jgi:hexosaminidase
MNPGLRRPILVLILILGLSGGAGMAGAQASRSIRAYRTESPVRLDGDLSKWRGAESVHFEGQPLGGRERSATVYALWDMRNLYLAFDVKAPKIRASVREHDGDKLWEDDGIEFLIDAKRHRTREYLPDDFAYHINIFNAVYDDRGTPAGQPDEKWNGKARHAVKILDDYHFAVEVAVPWKEIGLEPREGQTTLGVDFGVNGKDPATQKYVYYDWCGLKVFHDPSGYGDLTLAGRRRPNR